MVELTKIVIPKIMNEWEYIAEALHCDLAKIKAIRKEGRNPRDCCREFFIDWLTTNSCAKAGPKVWLTLLDALEKLDEISADITEGIIAQVTELSSQ